MMWKSCIVVPVTSTALLLGAVFLLIGNASATEHHVKVVDTRRSDLANVLPRAMLATTNTLRAHVIGASNLPVLTLSCPSGSVIVRVDYASYASADGSCFLSQAATLVSSLNSICDGTPTCQVTLDEDSLTRLNIRDPCAGTPKEMAVDYTCGTGANDGETLSLACPSGTITAITKTSYGAPGIACQTAHSDKLTNAMNDLCLGQHKCDVGAVDEGMLAKLGIDDPCRGHVKTMAAEFTCSPDGHAGAKDGELLFLTCPFGTITTVTKTTYGAPDYACQTSQSNKLSESIKELCVGRSECAIGPLDQFTLANELGIDDPCSGYVKTMAAHYTCSGAWIKGAPFNA